MAVITNIFTWNTLLAVYEKKQLHNCKYLATFFRANQNIKKSLTTNVYVTTCNFNIQKQKLSLSIWRQSRFGLNGLRQKKIQIPPNYYTSKRKGNNHPLNHYTKCFRIGLG